FSRLIQHLQLCLHNNQYNNQPHLTLLRPELKTLLNMADQTEVDLEAIIDKLLEVRGSRPGKQVQLNETEIRYLCTKAREIFISQPILLELEAPIKVLQYFRYSHCQLH